MNVKILQKVNRKVNFIYLNTSSKCGSTRGLGDRSPLSGENRRELWNSIGTEPKTYSEHTPVLPLPNTGSATAILIEI